jgi:hypothetical protein
MKNPTTPMVKVLMAFSACMLTIGMASAQDEAPAMDTTPPNATAADGRGNGDGTTIIGDRESPIGLYITPWRNAAAEADIDRPARLLSLELDPLDRRVFARQVEYYDALTAAQRAKNTTPAAPVKAP